MPNKRHHLSPKASSSQPLDQTVSSVGITEVWSYRYKIKGGDWLISYTVGTPGATNVNIANETGSPVTYVIEWQLQAFKYDNLVYTETFQSEFVVPATPVLSVSNWTIDPSSPQVSGSWEIGFDVSTSYTGDEAIQITANYQLLNGLDAVVASGALSVTGDGTYSATIPDPGTLTAGASGDGFGDVKVNLTNISIPNSAVTAISASNLFEDKWIWQNLPTCYNFVTSAYAHDDWQTNTAWDINQSFLTVAAGLGTSNMELRLVGFMQTAADVTFVVQAPDFTEQQIPGTDIGTDGNSFDVTIPLTAFGAVDSEGEWLLYFTSTGYYYTPTYYSYSGTGGAGLDVTSTICFS